MGTTESILAYNEDSPSSDYPVKQSPHPYPQRRPVPGHSSSSSGRSPSRDYHPTRTQQESRRPSSRPTSATIPKTASKPPLECLSGVILGLPASGRRTLLERLQGRDPFATHDNTRRRQEQEQALVPYQPPGFERIHLQVHIPQQQRRQDADFIVLLVDPRQSLQLIGNHLQPICRKNPHTPICALVNFRDQVDQDTAVHCQTQLEHHFINNNNDSLQVCGVSSLQNCFGLDVLHHFIYRVYLRHKHNLLTTQLQQIQTALKTANQQTPAPVYADFVQLLGQAPLSTRPRRNITRSNKRNDPPPPPPPPDEPSEEEESLQEQSEEESSNEQVVDHVGRRTILPTASSSSNAKQALEAFLASESDDESKQDDRETTSSSNSDDDDFFYDESGRQCHSFEQDPPAPPPKRPSKRGGDLGKSSFHTNQARHHRVFPDDMDDDDMDDDAHKPANEKQSSSGQTTVENEPNVMYSDDDDSDISPPVHDFAHTTDDDEESARMDPGEDDDNSRRVDNAEMNSSAHDSVTSAQSPTVPDSPQQQVVSGTAKTELDAKDDSPSRLDDSSGDDSDDEFFVGESGVLGGSEEEGETHQRNVEDDDDDYIIDDGGEGTSLTPAPSVSDDEIEECQESPVLQDDNAKVDGTAETAKQSVPSAPAASTPDEGITSARVDEESEDDDDFIVEENAEPSHIRPPKDSPSDNELKEDTRGRPHIAEDDEEEDDDDDDVFVIEDNGETGKEIRLTSQEDDSQERSHKQQARSRKSRARETDETVLESHAESYPEPTDHQNESSASGLSSDAAAAIAEAQRAMEQMLAQQQTGSSKEKPKKKKKKKDKEKKPKKEKKRSSNTK